MRTIKESTPAQRAKIGTLISKLKIDADTKLELIYTQSDGRTTSIRELNFKEADATIKLLLGGEVAEVSPADKMRRKIMSMGHELGWKLADGQLNMVKINDWCSTYGYLKKNIDQYTENELPALVTQFEQAYVTYLRKV